MNASNPTARKVSPLLAIYLRNHEAAAQGGVDLFARMARSQSGRPWGSALAGLHADVAEDLDRLRTLMRGWGVTPDGWAALAVRTGERIGRLKPNGHLLTRSPLSDLVEVEAALNAVHAKSTGWQSLRSATTPTPAVDLEELSRRADDQLALLRDLHAQVAAAVL